MRTYTPPMLRFLALCLCLAACGAEAPAPSTGDASTTDAGTDGPRLRCRNDQAFIGGRCVDATASNCGGNACRAGRECYIELGADGADDMVECY